MDLTLNPDQQALLTALDGLAAPFEQMPVDFRGFSLQSDALEQQLTAAEFFDVASIPGLGPVAAALVVERLARLPCTAEVALSMLVRPQLAGGEWPRPFALVDHGKPARFVAQARTLLIANGETLAAAQLSDDATESLDTIFAYPMGRLKAEPRATQLTAADAERARKWLRVALAAEAAGLMQGAIDSTVEHLSVRKQVGRPLGSFQALRHRMAECAVLA